VDRAVAMLAPIGGLLAADRERGRVSVPAPDGVATLRAVLARLDQGGIRPDDIGVRRPSLDDVFLALTGGSPAPDGDSHSDTRMPT
jgi:ABC-2 type transport system ATP-binding protein